MWDQLNGEAENSRADRMLTDTIKHGNQQDKIVAKMCEGKLMNCENLNEDDKMIYVEYGAGKAGLSSFVA